VSCESSREKIARKFMQGKEKYKNKTRERNAE
jgi:hypothetical protein